MKNKKGLIIGTIALIIVAIVIYCIAAYNSLVRAQENIQSAQSDISVVLTRRADLIPNLVETVKGYAAYEESVLTALADARARMVNGNNSLEDRLDADTELTQTLRSVFAISESYPELRANESFIALQDQLEGAENRISTARTNYNERVRAYNQSIRTFPRNIIANIGGFTEQPYFEGAPGSESVPEVNFG